MPTGGLGQRINEIEDWVRRHAPDCQRRGAGVHARRAARWCFRTAEAAAAFHARWGGTLIAPPPVDPFDPRDPLTWGRKK